MRKCFLFLLFFFSAYSFAAEINCSQSLINSLPLCDWSSSCVAPNSCFIGEPGVWGKVHKCVVGGWYDGNDANSDFCTGWDDGITVPSDTALVAKLEEVKSSVDVLAVVLVVSVLTLSLMAGFSVMRW